MIDLHSHTTNSDGTWTTKELLMKAEKLKLEALSITDHDTAKSYIEIEKNESLQNIFKMKNYLKVQYAQKMSILLKMVKNIMYNITILI